MVSGESEFKSERASENSSRGRNTEDKHKRNRKQRTNRRMRINMRVIERGVRQTDIDSAADKEVYTEAVVVEQWSYIMFSIVLPTMLKSVI